VIDKLEVRIPARAPYEQDFASLYSELRAHPNGDPFHPSRYYGAVGDLRPYGIDAILHAHCKFGKHGDYKVELLETGKRSLAYLVNEIGQIFDVDVMKLRIMRVDLAADVTGVPVWFFQDALRVAYKQVTNDIERADQFTRMGRGEVQTIYLGRRPNLFRVYNKIAELKLQYAALKRKAGNRPMPSFEDLYGYASEGFLLTRVERQIGGSRVPEQISTIELLERNALDFDPFERLEFLAGGKPEPNPDDYDLTKYLAGVGLRTTVLAVGMQRTRRLINKKSRGNAARFCRKFHEFLPVVPDDFVVPSLRNLYRESVARQLAV
jgi:hypothetical protein